MSKTNVAILILIIFLLVAGGIGLYLTVKPKDTKDSSASSDFYKNDTVIPTTNSADLSYTDASGFSFKYKSDYKVTDTTPDDNDTYSLLTITSAKDSTTLSIKDTKYKSLVEWEKDNKTAVTVGAVNLSGLSAKQYNMNANLVTVAIDQGIVYVISGKESDNYTLLTNTFSFSDPNKTASSQGDSDIIYEEEETVE